MRINKNFNSTLTLQNLESMQNYQNINEEK